MKLLVVSDSHRVMEPLRQVLSLYAKQVSTVVHLGDHAKDLLKLQKEYPALTLHAVAGNCDYGQGSAQEKLLTLNGRRLLLTHGHHHNIKMGWERLAYYAQEKEVEVCLFGHTHKAAVFEAGGVLFMNPGSIGQPRMDDPPGYGLLSVPESGKIRAVTLTLPL